MSDKTMQTNFRLKRYKDDDGSKGVEFCPPPIVKAFVWVAGVVGSLTVAGIGGILAILLNQSASIAANGERSAAIGDDVSEIKSDVRLIEQDVTDLKQRVAANGG